MLSYNNVKMTFGVLMLPFMVCYLSPEGGGFRVVSSFVCLPLSRIVKTDFHETPQALAWAKEGPIKH